MKNSKEPLKEATQETSALLPALLDLKEITSRLQIIFPEGVENRGYCTRMMAAKSIFTMLYTGAIENSGRWLSPKQIYHMSDRQARLIDEGSRNLYATSSMKPGYRSPFRRWYADNSREPIRDETLKNGLVRNGAVKTKAGVPTTSPKGRFALELGFAEIFEPTLSGPDLHDAILLWQESHLTTSALARLEIIRRGYTADKEKVVVKLPSGESRTMEAGLSSLITRGVAEEFAHRFLSKPAVIWISESGNKIVHRDDALAQSIGLKITPEKTLPDMILADVSDKFQLVFVEVVSTDGPVDEARKQALLEIVAKSGFDPKHVLFLSAFMDRGSSAFRQCLPRLAWGSFAWCVSEPDHLIKLNGGRLHEQS